MSPAPKNPASAAARVALAEPIQEGTPRTVHPIGAPTLPVGSERARQDQQQRSVIGMRTLGDGTTYKVETTEVKTSLDGKERRRFAAGSVIGLGVARRFGFLDAAGAGLARPGDEQPDVAPTDEPQAAPLRDDEGDGDEADGSPRKRATTRKREPIETTAGDGPEETS